MNNIHSEKFVVALFDEMAKTYGFVNLISSLGFAYFWRKSTVKDAASTADSIVDLMSGGGECLPHIISTFGSDARIDLVDWSQGMCAKAKKTVDRLSPDNCNIIHHSALNIPVKDNTYDVAISTFGLKTLTKDEIVKFAREIKRVLKPGGRISILEFSIPTPSWMRPLFKIYVKYYVPLLGRLFLGNPDNYRMLWKYTEDFGDCSSITHIFTKEGFRIKNKSHLLGSTTQLLGFLEE